MSDDPPDPPGYITRGECASNLSGIREQLSGINTKLDGILELKVRVTVLEEKDKARDKVEEKEDQVKTEKTSLRDQAILVIVGLVIGWVLQVLAKFI